MHLEKLQVPITPAMQSTFTNPSGSIVDRSIKIVLSDPDNTASRTDGLPAIMERHHRLHGTSLLASAGRLLKLNASTYASSCTIFHRYCRQVSLKKMNVWSVAMASTLLACKLEEETRPIRQVILIYARIYRKRRLVLCDDAESVVGDKHVAASELATSATLQEKLSHLRHINPMSPFGPVYQEWYNEIIATENKLLRQLGFTLYWIPDSHPHKFIIYFVEALDIQKPDFCQRAWNYCNDSCRLDLCLRFAPEVIACSAIVLSARDCQVDLPVARDEICWWHLFVGDARDGELSVIGNALLSLQIDCLPCTTRAFIPSVSGDAWNDPESYVWSVADSNVR